MPLPELKEETRRKLVRKLVATLTPADIQAACAAASGRRLGAMKAALERDEMSSIGGAFLGIIFDYVDAAAQAEAETVWTGGKISAADFERIYRG